jgi:hypothetical protein
MYVKDNSKKPSLINDNDYIYVARFAYYFLAYIIFHLQCIKCDWPDIKTPPDLQNISISRLQNTGHVNVQIGESLVGSDIAFK